ncbi:protein NipSnap homolog 3B-like isoform X2 [Eublepharis macularius]|uniref:Protein NipSnap homolog 3B-like isoform X2 n=1 Tax=Eublepharis macularius TaxID=481883 RepID=A0AA97JU57_EUBMA|nr:protein NipSnap homolog 3B-like isoform X2 [Eublepharis macularius]
MLRASKEELGGDRRIPQSSLAIHMPKNAEEALCQPAAEKIPGKVQSQEKKDNFAHRAAVRKALAKDKEWQETLSAILPLLKTQDMEIAYLVPWCELGTPPKEGVYELITYQQKPGGPALWGRAFKAAIDAHVSKNYAKLIGVFHTEYGSLNTVHVLWWHENPDSRAAGRHLAHEDARVVAAVRESVQFLESQRNVLLVPAPFSPLK